MILLSMRALLSYPFVFFLIPQVEKLAERMIKWLKDGGYIFFRESCFHQSGDSKRKHNPTHYREPRFYTKVCYSECGYISSLVCLNKNVLDINFGLICSV